MNPLIQGLFREFRKSEELEAVPDSDAFEMFASSLVIADDLLAQAQLTDFLLDPGTLGIDVAVLDINGRLAWDVEDVQEICQSAAKISVAVHFIQAKRSSSVSSVELLSFGDSVTRFLNNEVSAGHPRVHRLAEALRSVFDNHATALKTSPSVSAHFVTTATSTAVTDSTVLDRVATVRANLSQLGFVGDVVVDVLGADEIHEAWIKKNNANEVEIQLEKLVNLPKMPGIDQAILGIVSVAELLRLVQDDSGTLDERVFYDNVRGFKGSDNPVNSQILTTLASSERSLLPVLNNGVTVVATSYSPKPGDAIAITGYQIVNGCQTSHCLHQSRDILGDLTNSTFVPLRLVVTSDEDVATRIIRATNSQTEVQEKDLLALTKFQKRLEEFYRLDSAEVQLRYERRSGQFFEKDVTKTRVLTVVDQMRDVSALFLDLPHAAARYTDRLYGEVGESIFRDDHRLLPYVASAFAAYKLENAWRNGLDSSYKPIRYHILMTYKYQILGGKSASLSSAQADQQSGQIIGALKKPDQVGIFKSAAEKVLAAAGGQVPTGDRLKRQQFTQELITSLLANSGGSSPG